MDTSGVLVVLGSADGDMSGGEGGEASLDARDESVAGVGADKEAEADAEAVADVEVDAEADADADAEAAAADGPGAPAPPARVPFTGAWLADSVAIACGWWRLEKKRWGEK